MPGIDGFDVLRWIRLQPTIASLRVVVLTTSEETRDIDMAYKCGANSFLVKPSDFEHLAQVTQALSGYWVWLDRSPSASHPPATQVATEPPAANPIPAKIL
jgi:CheY-like chemotaxis protein